MAAVYNKSELETAINEIGYPCTLEPFIPDEPLLTHAEAIRKLRLRLNEQKSLNLVDDGVLIEAMAEMEMAADSLKHLKELLHEPQA